MYGALAIPTYWLTAPTLSNFNALFSLYVIFGIVTNIMIALLSIYIPHCMRTVNQDHSVSVSGGQSSSSDSHESPKESKARKYGFAMSIFGMLANSIAAVLIVGIIAIMSGTLPQSSQQSSGLLVNTIVGFITVFAAIGSFLGLPALPAKTWPTDHPWKTAIVEIFVPFRELLRRKNMLLLLVGYTVYTDTMFALLSIVGQLYYAEVQPNTLEFSLYSLVGNIFNVACTFAFYWGHRKFHFNLDKCLFVGYALMLILPVWGCIGISNQDRFGDKAS
jgi:hypothetical protein